MRSKVGQCGANAVFAAPVSSAVSDDGEPLRGPLCLEGLAECPEPSRPHPLPIYHACLYPSADGLSLTPWRAT